MHRYILFISLCVCIGIGAGSEIIPVNSGTGWDGKHYSTLAKDVDAMWANKQIDSYQFYRLLPPVCAHAVLKLFGLMPAEAHHVVNTFKWMNVVLILSMALLFFRLCTRLQLRKETEIVGFSALFLNFALLKQAFYYPVLTDVFAYFFGFLLIYAYLTRVKWLQFAALAAGSFTYPLFFITGAVLFIHPESDKLRNVLIRLSMPLRWGLLLLLIVLYAAYQINRHAFIQPQYLMHINHTWMHVSFLLVLITVYRLGKGFNASLSVGSVFDYTHNTKMLLFGLLAASYWGLQWIMATVYTIPETVFTTQTFLLNIFQQSFSNPLAFLVFHTMYFGPVVLLVAFNYKSVLSKASTYGLAPVLFLFCYSILALGTESRQFINAWPAFVCVALLWLNSFAIKTPFAWMLVIISLALSHFYLHINAPGIFETYQYGKFPEQYYFMHQGPFATDVSYLINMFQVIVTAVAVIALIKQLKTNAPSMQNS
ncbi:MAG: hypothetical protein ACK4Y6_05880 [Bacteroidota bacterium]